MQFRQLLTSQLIGLECAPRLTFRSTLTPAAYQKEDSTTDAYIAKPAT